MIGENRYCESADILAIKGLGQFQRFKAASALRQLLENWHVSDFHINSARGRKEATGVMEHLSETGDNLPRVAQYLYENHREVFNGILSRMQQRIPGISGVEPELTQDGYLILRFRDGTFKTPFLGSLCLGRYYKDVRVSSAAPRPSLRDQDRADCRKVKQALVARCDRAVRPDAVVRIACRELESLYLGDLRAVELGLHIGGLSPKQNKAKFRDPDRLHSPSLELENLTNYRYQKVAGSRAISPHLDVEKPGSRSFRHLIQAIRNTAA